MQVFNITIHTLKNKDGSANILDRNSKLDQVSHEFVIFAVYLFTRLKMENLVRVYDLPWNWNFEQILNSNYKKTDPKLDFLNFTKHRTRMYHLI